MRIEHIVDNETKARLSVLKESKGKVHPKKKKPKKRNREVLDERDLKELMGMNRQTYRRVNGAIRRK